MTLDLTRHKVGMTRVFDEQGVSVLVTVLDMSVNHVIQVESKNTDGRTAVQVTFGRKKVNRVNKAEIGYFTKAGVGAGRGLVEFALTEGKLVELKAGGEITVSTLEVGQLVDVTGTSRGKSFPGMIKHHNFGAQRTSHDNSRLHHASGLIGMTQGPGRVSLGKRMAGQYGNTKAAVQKLEVVHVDAKRQLLLVRGAVPGSVNSGVVVRPSVKVGA